MKTFISIILSVLTIIVLAMVFSIKVFGIRISDILFILMVIFLVGWTVLALADEIFDGLEQWENKREWRRKHGSK
jgi:uncharacterized membrane protein